MLSVADYEMDLDTVIGKGSFGTVHVATHKVAVKRIDPRDKSKVPQIAQSLRNLLELVHENVARVYDVHQKENAVFIFLELCSHGDMIDYFQKHQVSAEEKLTLMLDIAKGVQYLHSKNVIHRDIKPSNILVSGPPTTAKLVDFDHSKFFEVPYTTSAMGTNVGTTTFKAPEFFQRTNDGRLVYHRSVDIYAMGITFLAMIQENRYLFPQVETPNERSEESYEIGRLLWERQKYGVEPLQVVKIEDGSQSIENEVRREILKMTHVEPKERLLAQQVVLDLTALITSKTQGDENPALASSSRDLDQLLVEQASAVDPNENYTAQVRLLFQSIVFLAFWPNPEANFGSLGWPQRVNGSRSIDECAKVDCSYILCRPVGLSRRRLRTLLTGYRHSLQDVQNCYNPQIHRHQLTSSQHRSQPWLSELGLCLSNPNTRRLSWGYALVCMARKKFLCPFRSVNCMMCLSSLLSFSLIFTI